MSAVPLTFRLVSFRLQTILNQVSIQKKKAFVELVLNYWKLKRQSRNGLPLIRRLQTSLQSQKNAQPVCSSVSHPSEGFQSSFCLFCSKVDFSDLKHVLEAFSRFKGSLSIHFNFVELLSKVPYNANSLYRFSFTNSTSLVCH